MRATSLSAVASSVRRASRNTTVTIGGTMSEKIKSGTAPQKAGGPVVKTGPTAGQIRSRNADGQWRAKRSDAGVPRKK